MEVRILPEGDRLEVATADGKLFTFPIHELKATRRRPKPGNSADDLSVNTPLQRLEAARVAAEEFAILHGMI